MVDVLRNTASYYKYIFEDLADQRTNEYILTSELWIPLSIIFIYLILVKKILPDFMKNREPMKLDNIILFYNFTQILFNGLLLTRVIPILFTICPVCAPVDYSNSYNGRSQLEICHLYYLLKVYDLIDTVLFILRKKQRQVTFLHLYHHTMVIMISWTALRYAPGGNSLYVGFLNTFVHVIMYFYYGVTLWNSGKKNTIWWKRYVTQLQLVQFFLMASMGLTILFHPTCTYPKWLVFVALLQNIYLIYLFGAFYCANYLNKRKTSVVHQKIK